MSHFKMTDPVQVEAKRQETQMRDWIHRGERADFEAFVQGTQFLRMAVTPALLRALAMQGRDDWWGLIEDRADRGVVAKAAEDSLTWDPRPALADTFLDLVRPREQRAGTWRKAMFKGHMDTLERLERHWGTDDLHPDLFTQSLSQKKWDITQWLADRLKEATWTSKAVLAVASRPEAPRELKVAALASHQTQDIWRTAFKQAARIAHMDWLDLQEATQDCSAWYEVAVDAALSQERMDVTNRYLNRLQPSVLRSMLVDRIERNTGSFSWAQMDNWCAGLPEPLQQSLSHGLLALLPRTSAQLRQAHGAACEPENEVALRRRARP